jgi:hypothetical protein
VENAAPSSTRNTSDAPILYMPFGIGEDVGAFVIIQYAALAGQINDQGSIKIDDKS